MRITKKQLEKVVRETVSEIIRENSASNDSYSRAGREILAQHFSRPAVKILRDFVAGKIEFWDLPEILVDKLYDFFRDEMPIGIQKARTGDPDVWIADRLEQMLGMDEANAHVIEAAKAKKTEHSGAKKGNGAYWGRKKDAKKDSNKVRRTEDKQKAQKQQD